MMRLWRTEGARLAYMPRLATARWRRANFDSINEVNNRQTDRQTNKQTNRHFRIYISRDYQLNIISKRLFLSAAMLFDVIVRSIRLVSYHLIQNIGRIFSST